MSVHISQFYPCSEVSLACELYYICELGKYLKFKHEDCINLDGVILNSQLKKSVIWDYFRMAVDEGWVTNTGVDARELAITTQAPLSWVNKQDICNFLFSTDAVPFNHEEFRQRSANYDFDIRTPLASQVSFEVCNAEYWMWSMNGEGNSHFLENNKSLNHTRADQAWLSLIAMVAVERLKTGKPDRLVLEISSNVILNVMAMSYIMILTEKTLAFTGWCYYHLNDTISNDTQLQLGYSAWYAIGRDIGLLDRWYSGKEKLAYMQKLDLQVGDLVMIFDREKSQRQNYIKSIAGCHLAKILHLSERSVELELINTVKPYFQGKEDFDNHTIVVKKMFQNNPPYLKLSSSVKRYDLADIGVGYLLHNERSFILPLEECDDIKVTRVSDGTRKDTLVLNQNDLIYWILKDYDFEFNEDRFLARYFSDSEPAYTRYMRGEVLEDDYYFKAE